MVKRYFRDVNGHRFVVSRTDDEEQDVAVARAMKRHHDAVYHVAKVHGTDASPLQRLSRRLRDTIFIERDNDATIAKGIMVELCMRRHGVILDTHQLQHVFVHEMAHIMSRGWGHGSEFQENEMRLRNLMYTEFEWSRDPLLFNACSA
jgi:hypothetical protein